MLTNLIPVSRDLYISQGSSYSSTFIVKDENGVILDLTGMSVEAIAKRYANTERTYSLNADITSAVLGLITIYMDEGDTAELVNSVYVYEIKLSNSISNVKILSGCIVVSEGL